MYQSNVARIHVGFSGVHQMHDRAFSALRPDDPVSAQFRPKRGRKPLGDRPMTPAERTRRYRQDKRRQQGLPEPTTLSIPTTKLSRSMRLLALSDIHNNLARVEQL